MRKGSTSSTEDAKYDNEKMPSAKLRSLSTMPVPAVLSAPPTPTPNEEERGDLIRFYNQVFVKRVEEFVKQFYPSGVKDNNHLAPVSTENFSSHFK